MSAPVLLFVYGSLLVGTGIRAVDRQFERCTRGSTPVSINAWIHGRLYDLGPYPAALPAQGPGERVYGELFTLRDETACLAAIDTYEAYNPQDPAASEFIRHWVPVHRRGRVEPVEAWTYFYNGPVRFRPRITSGDYRRYLGKPATGP